MDDGRCPDKQASGWGNAPDDWTSPGNKGQLGSETGMSHAVHRRTNSLQTCGCPLLALRGFYSYISRNLVHGKAAGDWKQERGLPFLFNNAV